MSWVTIPGHHRWGVADGQKLTFRKRLAICGRCFAQRTRSASAPPPSAGQASEPRTATRLTREAGAPPSRRPGQLAAA